MNIEDFNRAQSNYDAMTPADRREPTDEDIRLYAEHIKPKLLRSHQDVGEMLASMTSDHRWDSFAMSISTGCAEDAYRIGMQLLDEAASDEAELISSDELYGDADHSDTLRRIGADDWRTFFAKFNAERNA